MTLIKKEEEKKKHVLTQRQVCKKSEHKLCTDVQCKLRRNVGWGWNCFCIGVCAFGDTVIIFKSSTHDRDVHVQFYGLNVSMVRVMLTVLCRSVCWGVGGYCYKQRWQDLQFTETTFTWGLI